MEVYRVNVDSESYFEANSFEIRPGVRIVDIRSIRGCIGGERFDAKDDRLKQMVMNYISTTDNVELINILSREYNGYDYFDAYDESYNSNVEYSKEQLLENKNSSHPAYAGCEQIVNPLRFLSAIRDKSNHIKPSALYAHLHKGLPRNEKLSLESLEFVPIWYINGAQRARADTCELFCCFEILIHILAKRFVDFKAKLLKLASTDIQLAKAENKTLERYQHLTQVQLIQEIKRLEAEKTDECEAHERTKKLMESINDKLTRAEADRQELKQELRKANIAPIEMKGQNDHMQKSIDTMAANIDKRIEEVGSNLTSLITKHNLTTATTHEVLCFYEIRALQEAFEEADEIDEDEVVLDVFRGQPGKSERNSMTRGRTYPFNEETDRRILITSNANAVDIFNWVKTKIPKTIARVVKQKHGKIYSIICKRDRVDRLVTRARRACTGVVDEFKDDMLTAVDELRERVNDSISETKKMKMSIYQLFRLLHPKMNAIVIDELDYLLSRTRDGNVHYRDLDDNIINLTANDIENGEFIHVNMRKK